MDLGESLSKSPSLGRVKLRRVELPEGAAENNGIMYHFFYRKSKKNFALVGIPELLVKQKWPTLEIGVQARKRWPRWS